MLLITKTACSWNCGQVDSLAHESLPNFFSVGTVFLKVLQRLAQQFDRKGGFCFLMQTVLVMDQSIETADDQRNRVVGVHSASPFMRHF